MKIAGQVLKNQNNSKTRTFFLLDQMDSNFLRFFEDGTKLKNLPNFTHLYKPRTSALRRVEVIAESGFLGIRFVE